MIRRRRAGTLRLWCADIDTDGDGTLDCTTPVPTIREDRARTMRLRRGGQPMLVATALPDCNETRRHRPEQWVRHLRRGGGVDDAVGAHWESRCGGARKRSVVFERCLILGE